MKNLLLIFSIVLIAVFLRFFSISTTPPSLTWDEAAWGYNAYSLGIDGRDEFGKFLPPAFIESFGDFKPPAYAYLSVLPVKLFGLNEFSTRFASAFFGILTVLLTYFLVKKIFPRVDAVLALFSAGILAISSWHILLSRAAFEANIATFFIALGVYLFLMAFDRKWLLPFSIISFIVSMYTFNTARIVAPLLVLVLSFSYRKYLFTKAKNQFLISVVLGALIFLPLFVFLMTPQARLRFHEVNIFSDGAVVEHANQQIENDGNAFWSKIIHNRRLAYGASYLKHYFDNLSPPFLFIKGDGNPKFSIQDVGQMYIWEIPFFIAGILYLFRIREGYWWIIPVWFMVGIIPAATARETPHALRIEAALPTFQILIAYGLYNLISNFKFQSFDNAQDRISNFKLKSFATGLIIIAIVFNFSYFLHNYFTHYPREFSGEWQYGYKEAIEYIKQEQSKYDAIYFTETLGRPYIYFLYYLKYDPSLFRQQAKIEREVYGFVHVQSFDKYYFAKDIAQLPVGGKILYFDTPERVQSSAVKLREFKLLNGQITLVAYTL